VSLQVCNVLQTLGIQKGDRVIVYGDGAELPVHCGLRENRATHSVVFGGSRQRCATGSTILAQQPILATISPARR
jgi:hypothetical protein